MNKPSATPWMGQTKSQRRLPCREPGQHSTRAIGSANPATVMAAYIVRHAKAGDRAEWMGDDRLRPLTTLGQQQAEELAESMSAEPIDTVLSSPYVRCVQTVEPLANRRKLRVEPSGDLEEGAGGERVIHLIEAFKGHNI